MIDAKRELYSLAWLGLDFNCRRKRDFCIPQNKINTEALLRKNQSLLEGERR